jgi:hypothetical protein
MKNQIMKAAAAVVMATGVVLTGLNAAGGIARAEPVPVPMYHWCPGEFWFPGWGFNWEWSTCHDDWHRDIDGDWHDRDWHPDYGDHDWHPDHDRDWHPDYGDHDWHPDHDHDQPWWVN